jgi:parvulin-like peptidyl-prolyl isomerase
MASPARRRRLLVIVPVVLAALAVGVVATTQVLGRGSTAPPRGPVAVVAGEKVPARLFDLRMSSALTAIHQGGGPQPGDAAYPAFLSGVRKRVLQSLIIDAVIAQEAAYRHLAASAGDVAAEVAADARSAGGDDELARQLAEAGGNLDQLRDAIRSRLDEQRLEDLFATQRAADIEARLAAGTPFETAASQLSDDEQSRSKGGDLGALNLTQLSASSASFVAAVRAAPAGRVSAPIRDDAGYEILRLDGETASTRSIHRILVAAPRPYTVRERPEWFAAAVFEAIDEDCRAGRLEVILDVGLQPCAPSRPAPGPSSAPPSPAATPGGAPNGFSPRP